MTHPQNISNQVQRDPLQAGGKNVPDPEKFKKVLGVDESEASDERGKRNSARQAEESEAEEEKETITPNKDLFSVLMSERSTKEINVSPSRDVTQKVSSSESTEGTDRPAPIDDTDEDFDRTDSVRLEGDVTQKKRQPVRQDSQPIDTTKKKPDHDPFEKLDEIQTKMHGLETPKKKSTKASSKAPIEALEDQEAIDSAPKTPHTHSTHAPTTQPAKNGHKATEKREHLTNQLSTEIEHKEPIVKPNFDLTTIPSTLPAISETAQPVPVQSVQGSTLNSSSAPYAQFSPQTFELFQKLVGMMTVMQFQGRTTTSITLNIPQSVLNGAKVDIEHYDTAPHSFNIQFFGSPEAQQLFLQNASGLEQQLKLNLPQFDIRVKAPLLNTDEESKEERKRRDTQVKKNPHT